MPKKAATHIYGPEGNEARNEDNMFVRLDEKVFNREDVLALGINVGDFIAMDTRTEITESGFVKSRYLDNKLAVAILLEIAKYFKENNLKPKYTTHFYITNYEEIGHWAAVLPGKTKEVIAVDIGIVGEGQQSNEFSTSIVAKDGRSPYDFEFRNKLVKIAEENNIRYVVDLYNRYSSDATHFVQQGKDVNFACLGPGVDASHHYERTHIESIKNTAYLLIKYSIYHIEQKSNLAVLKDPVVTGLNVSLNERLQVYLENFNDNILEKLEEGYMLDIIEIHKSYDISRRKLLEEFDVQFGEDILVVDEMAI